LEAGRAALADDRPWYAVARALALRKASNLAPEGRAAAEGLLEDAVQTAARQATHSDEFDLVSAELLPRRSRAIHAIGRGRRLLDERRSMDAYRAIAALEREHPTHHLRPEAGEVVARAGMALARDGGRYLLFFTNRARSVTPLEYLVVEHPTHPGAAAAYAELATLYEEANRLDFAIDRHSDLLLYHPESPFAFASEARVPELRLERLVRIDYDRGELIAAERELEGWIARHAGKPGAEAEQARVVALLAECRTRLVRHDLVVARFYARTSKDYGVRLHAGRALEKASAAGFVELAEEARELLADVGPTPAADSPAPATDSPAAATVSPAPATDSSANFSADSGGAPGAAGTRR